MNDDVKPCGECSLCCKLMGVDLGGTYKKAGDWCRHCNPGQGCAVHETRWDGCRHFQCAWTTSPSMPAATRPDKCKVVIARHTYSEGDNVVIAYVEPTKPFAYRDPIILGALRKLAKDGFHVGIRIGHQTLYVLEDGSVVEDQHGTA